MFSNASATGLLRGRMGHLVASTHNGLGRHVQYVRPSEMETILRLNSLVILFWCWAVTCIKISIALTLLRIKPERKWRIGLNCVIAVQVIAAVVNTLLGFLQCRPFWATLAPTFPGATCWSLNAGQIMAYCLSGKQCS
jgi:hypothetical protein